MLVEDIWSRLTTFSEEAIAAALNKAQELQLATDRGPVPLDESLLNLREIKVLLESLIRENRLQQVPITVQKEIARQLDSVSKALINLGNGADEIVNLTTAIEQLLTLTWQYQLHTLTPEVAAFAEKSNQLKSLQMEAQQLRKQLRGGLQTRKHIEALETEISEQKSALAALLNEVQAAVAQV